MVDVHILGLIDETKAEQICVKNGFVQRKIYIFLDPIYVFMNIDAFLWSSTQNSWVLEQIFGK